MRSVSVVLLAVVVLVLLLHPASASAWLVRTIPDPKDDPTPCNIDHSPEPHFVCNPDALLSPSTTSRINDLARDLFHAHIRDFSGGRHTSDLDLHGYEMAFYVVRRVHGLSVADFAQSLHNRLGVGDATLQNGVLVLVSTGDRYAFISVGAGTKKVLSPSVAEKLVSEIKPMMRRGDYDGGTLHLATRISEVLVANEEVSWFVEELVPVLVTIAFLGIFVSVVVCLIVFRPRKKTEPEYVQERLREIKAKMERDGRQPCTTCAICLEDFPEGAMDKEQAVEEKDVEMLACSHCFHKGCLDVWLGTKDECPACRHPHPREFGPEFEPRPDGQPREPQHPPRPADNDHSAFFSRSNDSSGPSCHMGGFSGPFYRGPRYYRTRSPVVDLAWYALLENRLHNNYHQYSRLYDERVAREQAAYRASRSSGSSGRRWGGGRSSGGGGGGW